MSPTVTCPAGHQSGDPEWCDTCGARLGAPATLPPPSMPPPSGAPTPHASAVAPVICPHCQDSNDGNALFCEGCGYDFVTGQAPVAPALAVAPSPVAGPPSVAGTEAPLPPPIVAAAAASGWVLVVEVEPDWYAIKGETAGQPCPPRSSSTVNLVGPTVLVGRTSASRQIHPEVALDNDTGVSRRHAQLVLATDGSWSVIDLDSSNGTYVTAADVVPDDDIEAIAVGIPTAVDDRSVIYVGAWTKLTLRDGRSI